MPYALRPIRSFVKRERKPNLSLFSDPLWKQYSITPAGYPISFVEIFGNTHPVTLEIGFGMGDSLFQQATHHPNQNYIGIEVYRTGIAALLSKLANSSLKNIRIIEGDAVEILSQWINNYSVHTLQVLFPDPWPKKRHHKRRLIQSTFIQLVYNKLILGGYLYLATDWEHYAMHMLNSVQSSDVAFQNCSVAPPFSEKPRSIPLTKFEQRGLQIGHSIRYLQFQKCH
jgi:tRNA (guanine-N7-)-methyltransferase